MADDSLTDDAAAFNQSPKSSSPSRRPTRNQYLTSIDKELESYLGRLTALITVLNHCNLSKCTPGNLRNYFVVLEELMFGANQTWIEITDQRRLSALVEKDSNS